MLTETYFAAMVKVFISYSHDDKEFCDNIKKYLKQFRDSVEIWADHEIKAGEEWGKTIEENLKEADIILFLVSINFINSGYIKDNELAVGYARRQGGSAEIIPILLTECEWERVDELARFQALPIDPSDKRAQYIDKWDEDKRAPVYNSIAVEINERASILIKNRQVREKNERLQSYRDKCQEFLSQSPDLELNIANKRSLKHLCEDLGIDKAEAEKAFEEAEKPFRVLKKNRERYLDTVKEYLSVGSNLSAAHTQKELKDLQLALKLEDGDISTLQPEIDRLADEQRAKEEEERKARDEEAKPNAEAERLAVLQPAKEEEDRKAREEEAKPNAEAERLAVLQRAKEEEDRKARDEEAKPNAEAERLAVLQPAKEEEERKARDEEAKAKAEAEGIAEEQRAKEEEKRKARQEEAKRQGKAERLASERLIREQQARDQALQQVPKQAQNQKQPDLQTLSISSAVLVQEKSRVLKRFLGQSWRIDRGLVQVKAYRQPLAEGIAITMVQIPAGSFQMGSPDNEAERISEEGPQHRVELQSFFLGQTPVTQAQWQAVASWPQVEMMLDSNPALFEGANRPVELVSWEEAIEFCRRLSQRSKLVYTLPSEAQWEYACRAGTTTPFAFGDTLTPDLANYDGNATYGSGPKGQCRQQTTEVGSFAANAWGLQDMHGNVWEWCLDPWHDSYRWAPADGSAWTASGGTTRLLRGGSWFHDPCLCRSAYRDNDRPDYRNDDVGFRVCCLPQD